MGFSFLTPRTCLLQFLVYLCAAEKELQINSPKKQYAILPSFPLCQVGFFTDLFPFKEKEDSGRLCATVLLKCKLSTNLTADGRQRERHATLGNSHETTARTNSLMRLLKTLCRTPELSWAPAVSPCPPIAAHRAEPCARARCLFVWPVTEFGGAHAFPSSDAALQSPSLVLTL